MRHQGIFDVTDFSFFRPDGVPHDRGRVLEGLVSTPSGTGRDLLAGRRGQLPGKRRSR